MINADEIFIVSASGGAWEDAWYYDHVIIGRENADKAFDEAVNDAEDGDTDDITLRSAYVAEDGTIRPKDGEPIRMWRCY